MGTMATNSPTCQKHNLGNHMHERDPLLQIFESVTPTQRFVVSSRKENFRVKLGRRAPLPPSEGPSACKDCEASNKRSSVVKSRVLRFANRVRLDWAASQFTMSFGIQDFKERLRLDG